MSWIILDKPSCCGSTCTTRAATTISAKLTYPTAKRF